VTVLARRSRFSSPYADRIATLIMLLIIPALIMPLAGASAAGPQLTATPDSISAGMPVVIRGMNFPRRLPVVLAWDGKTVGMPQISTRGNGTFKASFWLPAGAALGRHVLTASARGEQGAAGWTTGRLASTSITVVGEGAANLKAPATTLIATSSASPVATLSIAPIDVPPTSAPASTSAPTGALSTAAPTVTPAPTAAPTAVPAAAPPPSALPMPAPSAPTCSGCIAVPTAIDATGATDASALLQSFLATVPDGATIVFPAGATYRMDAGLLIQNRRDLTFVGNGATLRSGPNGTGQQVESLFYLGGLPIRPSNGITIRGFNLVGNSPQPGVYLLGQPEFASGITILGGGDIEVDAVTISGVFGDGLNANGGANGVWFHDSHVISNGRNGVSVIDASSVVVERTRFDRAGYSTFDIEPWDSGTVSRSITIRNTTSGTWTNSWLSGNGNPGTYVDGITFTDNTTDGTFSIVINLPRRQNVTITGNVARTAYAYPWEPLFKLEHIDGLTFAGNVVPYSGGMPGIVTDSTGVVFQP